MNDKTTLYLGSIGAVILTVVLTFIDFPAKEEIVTGLFVFSGLCLAFLGFAPVCSVRLRHSRLVRQDIDFGTVRTGSICLGVFGFVLAIIGGSRMYMAMWPS